MTLDVICPKTRFGTLFSGSKRMLRISWYAFSAFVFIWNVLSLSFVSSWESSILTDAVFQGLSFLRRDLTFFLTELIQDTLDRIPRRKKPSSSYKWIAKYRNPYRMSRWRASPLSTSCDSTIHLCPGNKVDRVSTRNHVSGGNTEQRYTQR